MNCKIGDIAVIIKSYGWNNHVGKVVKVVAEPPSGVAFHLPDGSVHHAIAHDSPVWVIESQGEPFGCLEEPIMYGVGRDEGLMPISDSGAMVDTMLITQKEEY